MFDFWPRPPERSYAELILKKMRPGDIHTHVFAQQFPIVLSGRKDQSDPGAGARAGSDFRRRPRVGEFLV